ncbi:hypothetical protein EVAR_20121_1 [Eumeta japonica]|uniref:Uncharacterized protein n=1 Tax=Eumeta variegata TaxID=151549 RepID=A0A4C1V3V2_EUMVA|nr:hypothetical protein EVAR_20121_1 [Eumeta japonica]
MGYNNSRIVSGRLVAARHAVRRSTRQRPAGSRNQPAETATRSTEGTGEAAVSSVTLVRRAGGEGSTGFGFVSSSGGIGHAGGRRRSQGRATDLKEKRLVPSVSAGQESGRWPVNGGVPAEKIQVLPMVFKHKKIILAISQAHE